MSDDQNNEGNTPELPDAGDLCDFAVEFIYGAASLGIKIAGEAESGLMANGKALNILTQIFKDIQMEITDCPHGTVSPDVYCHTCLPTYNACIAGGGSSSTCLSNYQNCLINCTPG